MQKKSRGEVTVRVPEEVLKETLDTSILGENKQYDLMSEKQIQDYFILDIALHELA